MDDEQECYKLWRIRKTIMQMCHDRNYMVSQEELDVLHTKHYHMQFIEPTDVTKPFYVAEDEEPDGEVDRTYYWFGHKCPLPLREGASSSDKCN